jgi:hypothetical protein
MLFALAQIPEQPLRDFPEQCNDNQENGISVSHASTGNVCDKRYAVTYLFCTMTLHRIVLPESMADSTYDAFVAFGMVDASLAHCLEYDKFGPIH